MRPSHLIAARRPRREARALSIALGVLMTLAGWLMAEAARADQTPPKQPPDALSRAASTSPDPDAVRGRVLFELNCAHCHGDDARGDEGPSLYDLRKSDARITRLIQEGIRGEMPRFGAKFKPGDIQALIAYLRTLKT